MSDSPASEPTISGGVYLRLVALGALIGIPAALLAVGFIALTHQMEEWLWTDLPDALGTSGPPWYLVLGLPLVGAAIVLLARTLLPGDGGHEPLGGLNATPTPAAYGPGVALAAIGTLPFGAVLGPEAPLIALGSVVGLGLTAWARLDTPEERAVLGTAGSFAAVAALFGGPLVAGMLLIEAGISRGASLIAALLPGLVAAALGYTLFVGFGNWSGIREAQLTLPNLPHYGTTRVLDLLLAVAVGLLAAILMAAIHRGGHLLQERGTPRLGMGGLLFAGALATGLIALIADWLGADSQDVLFSGQTSVAPLIAETSFGIVLLLLVAKGIAYAICLSCGFRGGPVFPAIFVGVAIATLAVVLFDTSPTLAVSIGTAAGMSAATRLLFAPLLFAVLLTGSAGINAAPAAVLAASTAWLVTQALDRRETAREAAVAAQRTTPAETPIAPA